MKLHELKKNEGATFRKKIVGRGSGSGLGKTSGRGEAGQNKRSGGGPRPLFEGGQMPLIRRLPKRGFTNRWGDVYTIVNVSALEVLDNDTVVTAELLKEKGIIGKIEKDGLKVLGNGKLTKKLTVKAKKFSKTAEKKIKKAGGSTEEA